MTFSATSSGMGEIRSTTNRFFVSLFAFFAFVFIVTPTYAQSNSLETTVQLSTPVDPGSQVTVQNMLEGNELYPGVTMQAQLLGGEELHFSVNGLEESLQDGQTVAIVQVIDGGESRTIIIQGGGGGSGGYIIGIEDL